MELFVNHIPQMPDEEFGALKLVVVLRKIVLNHFVARCLILLEKAVVEFGFTVFMRSPCSK